MTARILWIARDNKKPFLRQYTELRRLFSSEVQVSVQVLDNAEQAVDAFLRGGYDDWVVLVPLATHQHIIQACRDRRVKLPMRPKTVEVESAQKSDFTFRGQFFKFLGYERVTKIALELQNPIFSGVERDVRRVLYITQHDLSAEAFEQLKQIFMREVTVVHDRDPVRDGRDVAERMKRAQADDLVLVAPLSIFDQLTRHDIYPLWAEMRGVAPGQFQHVNFWRVKSLIIEAELVRSV